MINKEKFYSAHKNLAVNSINNLVEISIIIFPKKLEELVMLMENNIRSAIAYHANNMSDAFGLTFHDIELLNLLGRIEKIAMTDTNTDFSDEIYNLKESGKIFVEKLFEIQEELKNNHQQIE